MNNQLEYLKIFLFNQFYIYDSKYGFYLKRLSGNPYTLVTYSCWSFSESKNCVRDALEIKDCFNLTGITFEHKVENKPSRHNSFFWKHVSNLYTLCFLGKGLIFEYSFHIWELFSNFVWNPEEGNISQFFPLLIPRLSDSVHNQKKNRKNGNYSVKSILTATVRSLGLGFILGLTTLNLFLLWSVPRFHASRLCKFRLVYPLHNRILTGEGLRSFILF